ncbi:sialidase family protein [Arcanobacterium phocae]|uniref:sialidase family protein n=1 Tax=Arcanobacterium phocae TaxID=131112 RepID=UPI001C1139CE|nr:sialidase family protein [Arcanobacterium phocae]
MFTCLSGPIRIAQPIDAGEVRIPALTSFHNRILCFFDQRPAPAHGSGRRFTGEVMASDLPNPNRIAYADITAGFAGPQRYLLPEHSISSDACVASSDGQTITIAYSSVAEPVTYMSSRFAGPRLEPWIAYGDDLEQLTYQRCDELYEETKADAMFATSGSTIMIDDSVLIPYVMRRGSKTFVRVAHVRNGDIIALSEPVSHPHYQIDETSLAWETDKGVILNARIQGFEGRGAGGRLVAYSEAGLGFSDLTYQTLPDPGCNAKALGNMLIHPHSFTRRDHGAIIDMASSEVLYDFGPEEFGYCDAVWHGDRLTVVAERNNELWSWTLSLTSCA